MKTIKVVAALIVHDGRIFATKQGYGNWRGWWEFPGGNEEAGEAPEEALVREIREHLHSVKWLPADDVILNDIEKLL